ncbi:MAG: hypothetical protein AAF745_00160, partial [Planctomycetota bacterium]
MTIWDDVVGGGPILPSPGVGDIVSPAETEPKSSPERSGLWDQVATDVEKATDGFDPGYIDEIRTVNVASDLIVNTPAIGTAEHAIAAQVPPEHRYAVLERVAEQAREQQPNQRAGFGARLGTSFVQGAADLAIPIAEDIGAIPTLDPDQERFKQALAHARETGDPIMSESFIGSNLQKTARMLPPMAVMASSGKILGGGTRALGAGRAATAAATATGVSGSSLPMMYDQTYDSMIGEGIDPEIAETTAMVSAPIEAAIESILPDPFSGYSALFKGSVREIAKKLVVENTKNYGKELSEEALQGLTQATAMEVARQIDEDIPGKGVGEIFKQGWEATKESAVPLGMIMAPGMTASSVQTARMSSQRAQQYARALEKRQIREFLNRQQSSDTDSSVPADPVVVDVDENGFAKFAPESGTLGIPRSEMPQIKSEQRGALANFVRARGVGFDRTEVIPADLKPSQAEYSPEKVEQAREFEGPERAIVVSDDGYVIDGHHQWKKSLDDNPNEPIPVVRLGAPATQVIDLVREFPSSETDDATSPTVPVPAVEPQSPDIPETSQNFPTRSTGSSEFTNETVESTSVTPKLKPSESETEGGNESTPPEPASNEAMYPLPDNVRNEEEADMVRNRLAAGLLVPETTYDLYQDYLRQKRDSKNQPRRRLDDRREPPSLVPEPREGGDLTDDASAQGADDTVSPRDLEDTRGQGIQYHGARGEVTLDDEGYSNENNIYGGFNTFYTTDAKDVAQGYGRKKPNAKVYRVTEKEPVRFYDMEQPIDDAERFTQLFGTNAKGEPDDILVDALASLKAEGLVNPNLRQVMDEIRAESQNYAMSKSDVQELFDTATYNLQQEGFGGMSHVGGLRTNRPAHTVKIYFDPVNQLDLEDDAVSPRPADIQPSAEPSGETGTTPTTDSSVARSDEPAEMPVADTDAAQGEDQAPKARADDKALAEADAADTVSGDSPKQISQAEQETPELLFGELQLELQKAGMNYVGTDEQAIENNGT